MRRRSSWRKFGLLPAADRIQDVTTLSREGSHRVFADHSGRKTKTVTKSDRRHGHIMGQPFRFIHGHVRSPLKGPNRFKPYRDTAVIFLERRDASVLECLVSRK